MAGELSPDPQNTPRQRRFDQRVAVILNDLIRSGQLSQGSGGWELAGSPDDAGVVLATRAFNHAPRYGQFG
jgi:hypothetical protein